jgi:phosphomannomutase
LPTELVEELNTSWQRSAPPLFDEDGAVGLLGEGLDARTARRVASAFATMLVERAEHAPPTVIVAGDGRPASAELVAAASDGLRWAGCQAIETPSATSASLLFTQRHYQADGALLVGNAAGTPRTGSLRCFGRGGRPMTIGPSAEDESISAGKQHYEGGPQRQNRRYGPWRRGSAETEYLASLAGRFHALRPLKFRWESSCAPAARYLKRLLANVACRPIGPSEESLLPPSSCHFGIWIDGDGERCRVSDEAGRPLESYTVLLLLATFLIDSPGAAVVVEQDAPDSVVQRLERIGAAVIRAAASRSAMHRAMSEHEAQLGGGPSGRFWFRAPTIVPDALHALALLLTILSQSDRPLSEVAAEVQPH